MPTVASPAQVEKVACAYLFRTGVDPGQSVHGAPANDVSMRDPALLLRPRPVRRHQKRSCFPTATARRHDPDHDHVRARTVPDRLQRRRSFAEQERHTHHVDQRHQAGLPDHERRSRESRHRSWSRPRPRAQRERNEAADYRRRNEQRAPGRTTGRRMSARRRNTSDRSTSDTPISSALPSMRCLRSVPLHDGATAEAAIRGLCAIHYRRSLTPCRDPLTNANRRAARASAGGCRR